jgi:hypothetical protein
MSEKDRTIASLQKQLSELQKRCHALEQENALLFYQLDKIDEKELFDIPDYGTGEWADWMIKINKKRSK